MRISAILAVLLLAIIAFSDGALAQIERVNAGQTKTIDAHGVCRKVTNTGGASFPVFYNTAGEWASFRNNKPGNASLAECGGSCNVLLLNKDCAGGGFPTFMFPTGPGVTACRDACAAQNGNDTCCKHAVRSDGAQFCYLYTTGSYTINYVPQSGSGFTFTSRAGKCDGSRYIAPGPPPTDVKVICTHYNSKGLLSDDLYNAEVLYSTIIDKRIMVGYHVWAKPFVKWLEKNEWFDVIAVPLVRAWATEVSYRMGMSEKGSALGKIMLSVGIPISYGIGYSVEKINSYYLDFRKFISRSNSSTGFSSVSPNPHPMRSAIAQ